jgi:gliding motility-associated-like protein
MKRIIALFFVFTSINCFSQFSKTHYIPPLTCVTSLAGEQYLYISTPSSSNVNFKIVANDGNSITGVVSKNTPYVYFIGQGINTPLFTPKENIGKVSNKGYVIEAEDLIYASVRINSGLTQQNGYVHAGGLVSKGNSALGKIFRLGAMLNPIFDVNLLNFASILSTENGTKVTLSNIPNGTILTDGTTVTGPITIILNKNESYVLALENNNYSVSNSSKIIGALVESDKPVVVNSGSFGGSNSTILDMNGNLTGRDIGFDQIVPLEKTGKEYIFVKGLGTSELERVILIAHEDQTQIFLNGNASPFATLNKGQFIDINGNQFIDSNLYVLATENVFAYQCIAGTNNPANQNLFFVPPLNCATPNIVDNIPMIESIGNVRYNGGLNIVTEAGASVTINNAPISATAVAIAGNPLYERYTLNNLTGNISIKSTKQLYISYFGTNGAATYGGYYSGFDTKPEITSDKITVSSSACIPNVNLKVSTLSSYDTFQWFFNEVPIPGANSNSYTPTQAGYYQVRGSISGCGVTTFSDKIPVSICPLDTDNDGANNNFDIDLDNDGIRNDFEAGMPLLNQSNLINSPDYTGTISGAGSIIGKPYYGFVSEVPAGKTKNVVYTLQLNTPTSLRFNYMTFDNSTQTTAVSDYLNADGDFILRVPTNKTLTLLDPSNELLVDTNYDGIYESGVSEFSSFEIRFRLKSTLPAIPGSSKFSISTYLTNSITYEHHNLSETAANKATFSMYISYPTDNDSDGIPDLLDLDSDNEGVPDSIEAQGKGFKVYSGIDTNKDGLDDAFEPGFIKINTDNDYNNIPMSDVFDLDSDNDGIFDLVESGSNAIDANKDGIIDGLPSSFGTNGLFDRLETSPDSGKLNYTIVDTDTDGTLNYIDLDSDNDLCNDVIEAGFTDTNNDGILGNTPITVNTKGIVSSRTDGYTNPHANYKTAAPIIITTQPANQSQCELQNTNFTIATNPVDSYQWQLSTDGGILWTSIANNTSYSGSTTTSLQITRVISAMNGYQYRVILTKNGNTCGLTSNAATLTILALPIITTPLNLVQCDLDTDGISDFNLTEKNSFISSNYLNETFSYYKTAAGAQTKNVNLLITNPTTYRTPNGTTVWVRIESSKGCFSVAQLNLMVSTTQISNTFKRSFSNCDDYIDAANDDKDGIATFNFSSVTTDIQAMLPAANLGYSIKYYTNENDALAETNEITNPHNYRNIGHPNQQEIWVRIDSNLDNACFGLGNYITLTVNPLPNINENSNHTEDKLVCTNLPTFFVQLNAGIQDTTPASNYTYVWSKDGAILTTETTATLDVNTAGNYTVEVLTASGCSRTRTIKVTASDIAKIESLIVVDLSDFNTITINTSGKGQYEYSLNEPNGPYQPTPFFENVPLGIHEVYINDKNGCGKISKTVAVIGAPKFFTPNGDGYNDYWNVKGLNTNSNKNSIIYIFDRYGKLMKQILPTSKGWDGTLDGIPVPADDYWYTAKLQDGRETKGHFSLKR